VLLVEWNRLAFWCKLACMVLHGFLVPALRSLCSSFLHGVESRLCIGMVDWFYLCMVELCLHGSFVLHRWAVDFRLSPLSWWASSLEVHGLLHGFLVPALMSFWLLFLAGCVFICRDCCLVESLIGHWFPRPCMEGLMGCCWFFGWGLYVAFIVALPSWWDVLALMLEYVVWACMGFCKVSSLCMDVLLATVLGC
jgi:hypothetical protein